MNYLLKKFLILTLPLFSLTISAQDSGKYLTIEGVVNQTGNGKPVSFAHVFINNSTHGTYTDENGRFQLNEVENGKNFELIVSHVSFVDKKNVIDPTLNQAILIVLEPATTELNEIVITQKRDKEWEKSLKTFTREFLGYSVHSRMCKIENPEVLDFEVNDEIINAIAYQPLQIINRSTGYKLTYHLKVFEYNKITNLPVYSGYAYMEEIETPNRAEKRKWYKNRQNAYNGSLSHLIKSIINNEIRQNGFEINDLSKLDIHYDSIKSIYSIFVNDEIEVKYYRENEPIDYLNWINASSSYNPVTTITKPANEQLTIIRPLDSSIQVDINGRILNEHRILQKGYMGWERIAQLVPYNYKPSK